MSDDDRDVVFDSGDDDGDKMNGSKLGSKKRKGSRKTGDDEEEEGNDQCQEGLTAEQIQIRIYGRPSSCLA